MNSICNGYCGRLCLGGNFTECGACPWGWMMNHSDYYLVQPDYYLAQPQICYPCENTFDSYDWLFIIFNFGMLYMLHAQAILRFSVTEKSNHLVEYLASFIEISFGFLLTIILYSPIGSFYLNACYTSRQIRKNIVGYWYLVPNVNRDSYFNPFQSNGLDAEDCLYEVVYPRFSIILCSISFSLIFTVFCHPTALHFWNSKNQEYYDRLPHYYKSFSSILLLYPIYIAVYIVAGGVLYYLYNFIMLIIALISISFYLAYVSNRDIKAVFSPENRFKHIPAILSHLFLLGLSIWSFYSRPEYIETKYFSCFVLPFLSIVYLILTEKISNPKTQKTELENYMYGPCVVR